MIPRTLHRVWLGGAPIPDEFERYWETARSLLPGWTFKTWTEAELDWLRCRDVFDRAQSWSSKSDVVRFEVLAREGGVYIDTDVELLRPFDDLLMHGAFAGWEVFRPRPSWKWGPSLGTAVMGSEAHHPAIEALVQSLPAWFSGRSAAPANVATGPVFLTRQWEGRDDVTVLPQSAFFHGGPGARAGQRPASAYAIHHWAGSWLPQREAADEGGSRSVSILVPYRFADPHRDELWAWARRYWSAALPRAEVLTGSDDGSPFSRARAINDAAARATGEIFVVVDSDVVPPPPAVRAALRRLKLPGRRWIVPFTDVYRLTEETTKWLLKTDPARRSVPPRWRPRECEQIEKRTGPLYGSQIQVLPAKAFREVGGLDPRFRGWGREDNAFCMALDTLWARHETLPTGVTHMWHPRRYVSPSDTNLWEGQTEPSSASIELLARYAAAKGKPELMRQLIAERESVPVG